MRVVAPLVFVLAVATMELAGAGLIVAPHGEAPGSAPVHEHAVTVYRFPLLLLFDAPGIPSEAEFAAHARGRHEQHTRWAAADGSPLVTFLASHPLAQLAGSLALALIALAFARLPRPTRRPIARLALPVIAAEQWLARIVPPPPRLPAVALAVS